MKNTHGDDAHPAAEQFTIERATAEDREAILRVMRPWNMHRVPSPEVPQIDPTRFFVARVRGEIVAAGGYEILPDGQGKTTLLGVLPEFNHMGIGHALQDARLREMACLGAETVTTNADRPGTILWYKRVFGYREIGRLEKLHSFGDPTIDHWTTLRMDLREYLEKAGENRDDT